MRTETLRAIAAAVAPPMEGAYRAFFSKAANAWSNITGTAGGFFDHDADAHVSRTDTGLFHHGLGSHIHLKVDGAAFGGFDHGSQRYFKGSVRDGQIVVHDLVSGRDHLYAFKAEEG